MALLRTKTGKIFYQLWSGEKAIFHEQREGWYELQNRHLALGGLRHPEWMAALTQIAVSTSFPPPILAFPPKPSRDGRTTKDGSARQSWSGWKLLKERGGVNASGSGRRPEIVLDMLSREKSVFDERDVAEDPASLRR